MIDAVFEHQEGYRFNEVFVSKRKFLSRLKRDTKNVFLHAVDYETHTVIYPSTLPDYSRS